MIRREDWLMIPLKRTIDLASRLSVPQLLARICIVLGINPTIGKSARSGRLARLISRELAKARIAPILSLQAVTAAPEAGAMSGRS